MRRPSALLAFLAVQIVAVGAFVLAWTLASPDTKAGVESVVTGERRFEPVEIPRKVPLAVEPLYDDPRVVSDADLAMVLEKIRPAFARKGLRPNFVEHALRAWSVRAKFGDPQVLDGDEMLAVLTDHGRFVQSWTGGNEGIDPLLQERGYGIGVRWGQDLDGSVHHDHLLASLTEAGVTLNTPVYPPTRRGVVINDVLQQALRDFRLDERETEWSAMAFALWLPPVKEWQTANGRRMNFDRIARRLMRGHQRFGVCSGTHRVYSLALIMRLDEQYDLVSDEVHAEIVAHLKRVRDLIVVAQFPDGHWPSNWSAGLKPADNDLTDAEYRTVIATGHHLEWLAIVPEEFHPPREQIYKAADWLIRKVRSKPQPAIGQHYTFYSHVGNALALWRKTHSAEFWAKRRAAHPQGTTVTAPRP